jgi:hypothetical protein
MFHALLATAIKANGPPQKKPRRGSSINAHSHGDHANPAMRRGHDYDLLRCDGAVDDFLFDIFVHPTL